MRVHTLSVQEVADGNRMVAVALVSCVAEHLLKVVALGTDTEILLAQGAGMVFHAVAFLFRCQHQRTAMVTMPQRLHTSCSASGIF